MNHVDDYDSDTEYFSQADLVRRGWTLLAITTFLGDPDGQQENPIHPRGAPMRLFKATRVFAVERSPEFMAWSDKRKPRRKGAGAV